MRGELARPLLFSFLLIAAGINFFLCTFEKTYLQPNRFQTFTNHSNGSKSIGSLLQVVDQTNEFNLRRPRFVRGVRVGVDAEDEKRRRRRRRG